MKKLNQKKIRWIIRWKERGKSVKDLALAQKITERRVKQLWAEYRKTNKAPSEAFIRKMRIEVWLGFVKD